MTEPQDPDRHTPHPGTVEAPSSPPVHAGPRRLLWLVIVVAGAGAVGSFVLSSRHRSESSSPGAAPAAASAAAGAARPVAVVVAIAEKRDLPIYLDGIGNAVPIATVTVRSQVDGRLDKVLFREGQRVKKGEVLAQIDPRPFLIQLHQADAAIARDSAQARNARLNLGRYQALVAQKLIPQQQVDDQQTAADQADAAVAADRAQAENARLSLDYALIKSPLDGVTGVRLVDPGNIVHASDPGGIVVVTQLDPMAVLFTLPQDDLPDISREMAKGELTVDAYTRDGSKYVATGKLALIDNQVNQTTATIRLKAMFPNPERTLWPNAFLKTRLLVRTQKDALVVPSAAIQHGPQGTFVYAVDSRSVATLQPVVVSATQDELSILSSGLSPGDRVVVEGQNQLRPGAKVAARTAASPAPPVASDRPHGGGESGKKHGTGAPE